MVARVRQEQELVKKTASMMDGSVGDREIVYVENVSVTAATWDSSQVHIVNVWTGLVQRLEQTKSLYI